MKRTYVRNSDSFPGRVIRPITKWTQLSSTSYWGSLRRFQPFCLLFVALSCHWEESIHDLFRRFVQDCFNNLFNCRENQFFSNCVGPASFRYQQRNVVRSLLTVIWIFWWGSKHIHCFSLQKLISKGMKERQCFTELSGWIFCKCYRSLDGFIASLEKFFSQTFGLLWIGRWLYKSILQVLHRVLPTLLFRCSWGCHTCMLPSLNVGNHLA